MAKTTGKAFWATVALTGRMFEVQAVYTSTERIRFRIVRDAGANLLSGVQGAPDHANRQMMARLHAGEIVEVLPTFFWGWESMATKVLALPPSAANAGKPATVQPVCSNCGDAAKPAGTMPDFHGYLCAPCCRAELAYMALHFGTDDAFAFDTAPLRALLDTLTTGH